MKYDDRAAGLTCGCGEHMGAVFTAPAIIKGFTQRRRLTPPDVGPLSKASKARQKKDDEENSSFYRPDQTFGQGSVAKFNKTQQRKVEADKGKTNFTKDK